jgi:hypothetical protein
MTAPQLTIELTEEEKALVGGGVTKLTFGFDHRGLLRIIEHWDHDDEIWGPGCSVHIPPRAWKQAVEWIAAKWVAHEYS